MPRIGALAVYLTGPDGNVEALLPGQQVPAWAEGLIGDHALSGKSDPGVPAGSGERRAQLSAMTAEAAADDAYRAVNGFTDPPPQAGAGSGRDHWADYATEQGVAVGDDWKRDRIIDACRQAGIRVE